MIKKNVIDISRIPHFWIVYLMPFDNQSEEIMKKYQENCINKKIFGIGWHYEELDKEFAEKKLDEEVFKEYKKRYNSIVKKLKKEEKTYNTINDNETINEDVAIKTLSKFKEIESNDLIIMRLKNGNYYIGQVNKEAYYCNGIDSIIDEENTDRFSWYCGVDNWYEFSEEELPGDIVGRFSQRRHQTIQKINNDRIKLLIVKMFQEKSNNSLKYFNKDLNKYESIIIPKIVLNKNNYTNSLNYMELEDLVYTYMINENENYILYPSQCKISKIKYEFVLVDRNGLEKEITCQVKNHESLYYDNYIDDAKKEKYKIIYLFSGNNIVKGKEQNERIKIINKQELYSFLSSNVKLFKKLKERFDKYYKFSDEKDNFENIKSLDNIKDWRRVCNFKERGKKSIKNFQQDDCYISFKVNKRVYYNNDFKSFIVLPNESNKADYDIIENIIEEWSEILF